MDHKIIAAILLFPSLLFSHALPAAELEDVIYLDNGSIIRGLIIENRPKEGIYKIQTPGGNIMVLHQDEIEKITREAPLGTAQRSPLTRQASSLATTPPSRRHALGLGSYLIGFQSDKAGSEVFYEGGALYYQYGFSNHLALRINGYDTEYEYDSRLTISGVEGQLLLTTKARGNGFKLYLGAGYFSETLNNDIINDQEKNKGAAALLGIGYNWSRVALDFHLAVRDAGAYQNLPDDAVVTTGALDLGFRF